MTPETMHNLTGIAGLMIFFIFFVSAAVWMYRPGAKKSYDRLAQIPFMEDNHDQQ